jgi:hypothetical protein
MSRVKCIVWGGQKGANFESLTFRCFGISVSLWPGFNSSHYKDQSAASSFHELTYFPFSLIWRSCRYFNQSAHFHYLSSLQWSTSFPLQNGTHPSDWVYSNKGGKNCQMRRKSGVWKQQSRIQIPQISLHNADKHFTNFCGIHPPR